MSNFQWKELLTQWSKDIIESGEFDDDLLPANVKDTGWLGFDGATEIQIADAELRLGTKLPPSYREFLEVSNGWRITTPFMWKLWPVEEIEWLPKRNQELVDIWTAENLTIPDENYLVYGENQDCSCLRSEYFPTALEISDWGDSSLYLLNPQIVTSNGEWEAWSFANWKPGAERYQSYWEMMVAEHQSFLNFDDDNE